MATHTPPYPSRHLVLGRLAGNVPLCPGGCCAPVGLNQSTNFSCSWHLAYGSGATSRGRQSPLEAAMSAVTRSARNKEHTEQCVRRDLIPRPPSNPKGHRERNPRAGRGTRHPTPACTQCAARPATPVVWGPGLMEHGQTAPAAMGVAEVGTAWFLVAWGSGGRLSISGEANSR